MLKLWLRHEHTGYIINNSYQVHRTVRVEYGDMHAFNVIEDGKRALVITLKEEEIGFVKTCSALLNGIVELNLDSPGEPETVFQWNARDHIMPEEVTFRGTATDEEQCEAWDAMLVSRKLSPNVY
jgi:hypothetical protein